MKVDLDYTSDEHNVLFFSRIVLVYICIPGIIFKYTFYLLFEIYRKVAKLLRSSCTLLSQFSPVVNILHNHGTFVKTKKSAVIHYYLLNSRFYPDCSSFSTNVTFLFCDSIIRILHCI